MYKIYITNYNTEEKDLIQTYSDKRMLKNRTVSDIRVYLSDNALREDGNWDFSIYKVVGDKEIEFGNKDILFLFV